MTISRDGVALGVLAAVAFPFTSHPKAVFGTQLGTTLPREPSGTLTLPRDVIARLIVITAARLGAVTTVVSFQTR